MDLKPIAIYGAGGFGKEVACLINKINEKSPRWNIIGFFDDGKEIGAEVSKYGKVLGGLNELNGWPEELDVALAMGNTKNLRHICGNITNERLSFPNIIHPDTIWADEESCVIGKGNIIQRACAFSCDVTIGDFNLLNGSVTLGHDAVIGSQNVIMPGVRISGACNVGDGCFFGVGSIVLQELKIPSDVSLSAGAVLMTKPKSGNLYIGNPAKAFKI